VHAIYRFVSRETVKSEARTGESYILKGTFEPCPTERRGAHLYVTLTFFVARFSREKTGGGVLSLKWRK